MSMRILFSRTSKQGSSIAGNDPPEKGKSRARSIFKFGPETCPAQSKNAAFIQPEHEDDDEGAIELDIRCCLKFVLLTVCIVFFAVSVFACGAAYASQDSVVIPRRFSHQPPQPSQPSQPPQPPQPRFKVSANKTRETTGTVEYIEIRFDVMENQVGAIASLDECIKLMMQSSGFKIREILSETGRMLLRSGQENGATSDLLLEHLNTRSTVERLQSCSKVLFLGEPEFVYR